MAQPRPATPNYVEENNRARQQARSARKQRIGDIVNPLDSAATMDRLQGVEVSDFSSGGADSPPINLVGMLASGGAGTATNASPFRTAGGSGAAAITQVAQPESGGNCQIIRGQKVCGLPQSMPMGTVASGPVVTTTVPAQRPATATTAPTVTRKQGESEADFVYRQKMARAEQLRQRGLSMGDEAIGFAGSAPSTAGPMIVQGGRYKDVGDSIADEARKERNDEFNMETARMASAAGLALSKSEAEKNYSDARVNDATADAVGQKVGTRRMNASQDILADAVLTGATPNQYADAMLALDSPIVAELGDKGYSFQTADPNYLNTKRKEYLRQGFAAQGIHILVTSEAFHELATTRPTDETTIIRAAGMIGKDPETGEPVEITQDVGKATDLTKRKNAALGRSVSAIVNGYKETGVLGGSWENVMAQLEGDLYGPMRKYMVQRYMEKNQADIDALPEDFRADAMAAIEGRATALADTWFKYIANEVSLANRAAGGGSIENPSGDPNWFKRSQAPDNWSSKTNSLPTVPEPRQPKTSGMRME